MRGQASKKKAREKKRMNDGNRMQIWVILLSLILIAGCSDPAGSVPAGGDRSLQKTSSTAQSAPAQKKKAAPVPEKEMTQAELVAQGRKVYQSNCTACHNMNPSNKGSLGPAVAGSSEELVEARVVHGNYPPGYTPKADTRLMVALPYLAKDVKAITAYLQSQ